ncbi:rhodanese-like domain-containing protein [Desulfovibrio cuneatus]|uniref:rhodanese-like domain-containing protein n=1 Tax=Desulfovibrio cuneatus TaxID=159728 RepID=UPI0004220765|nr:rhodanese-like domain-containing protein [Desulfovibrio cuneatus]
MSQLSELPASEVVYLDHLRTLVVDVRTAPEYADIRLAGPHAFMPLDTLDPEQLLLQYGITRDTPVYALCASGARARKAGEALLAAGFTRVALVQGGITALKGVEVPLAGPGATRKEQGKGIPLERQLRIAIGILFVFITALACWVHPIFSVLAFLFSVGLVASAILNRCGLAFLLAKAPWNKQQSCSGSSCSIGGANKPGASCQ